ncbi:MAG: hypothetical protein A2Y89_07520 [Chloroflexi bacterium RBG_13_51_18]|nr:MAG: hypothetical protein A2Y89_07520 [Chloroflexi bacterium RBG_13_51_18]
MQKTLLVLILLLVISTLLWGCTTTQSSTTPAVTQATPTPTPTPTPTIKTTPADIKVISLSVTPIVVEPGKPITVEVKVTNVGGTEDSHRLTLNINGTVEEVKSITLAPGTSVTVAFTLIKEVSGLYEIEVAGLIETLRVRRADEYPRLANLYAGIDAFYWKIQQYTPTQIDSLIKILARWDIIAVDADLARFAPEYLGRIKELNPQIKILAVIGAGAGAYWRWMLTNDLEAPDRPSWITLGFIQYIRDQAAYYGITAQDSNESLFLHYGDTPGNPKPPEQKRWILWASETESEIDWPGMNPNSEWATFLPNLVHDKLMLTGLFNGVWYDCFLETMWESNLDIDNDGVGDSLNIVNQKYQEGMTRLLQLTRELLGPEAIIIGNPGNEWSENSPYYNYANGLMQECALGIQPWSNRDFSKIWQVYQRNMQKLMPPFRIHWIDADTNNVKYDTIDTNLPSAELQKMRYGLSITLLDDGYYGFDIGNEYHNTIWWFPEYDTNLGLAKGKAQQRDDGTWKREFENGVVLVNPTNDISRIEFDDIYQDVSTGERSKSFAVRPNDGRIFLKIQ